MDNGLLNKDGIIVFDNALSHGYPYLPETTAESQPLSWAIKECNEFVSDDPRVCCVSVCSIGINKPQAPIYRAHLYP